MISRVDGDEQRRSTTFWAQGLHQRSGRLVYACKGLAVSAERAQAAAAAPGGEDAAVSGTQVPTQLQSADEPVLGHRRLMGHVQEHQHQRHVLQVQPLAEIGSPIWQVSSSSSRALAYFRKLLYVPSADSAHSNVFFHGTCACREQTCIVAQVCSTHLVTGAWP